MLALLVIVLIFQSVRLFYTVATPVGPVGDWRPPMARIIAFEERAGLLSAFDPFYRGDAPRQSATQITSLDLTLFGVTLNRASGDGSAIIAGPDGVQNSIALGEEVAPGAVLVELAIDHIWIESGGQREVLYLDQSIPADQVAPDGAEANGAEPPPGEADRASTGGSVSPMALVEGLNVQPRREGDRTIGLSVSAKGDGQLFRQVGLRPGDVITSVNGQAVRSPGDFASLARAGSTLSIRIRRGTETVPVSIRLE